MSLAPPHLLLYSSNITCVYFIYVLTKSCACAQFLATIFIGLPCTHMVRFWAVADEEEEDDALFSTVFVSPAKAADSAPISAFKRVAPPAVVVVVAAPELKW